MHAPDFALIAISRAEICLESERFNVTAAYGLFLLPVSVEVCCTFDVACIGKRHASEIGSLAVDLLKGLKTFVIPHLPQEQLKMRIGLHTG